MAKVMANAADHLGTSLRAKTLFPGKAVLSSHYYLIITTPPVYAKDFKNG